jgi:hypothetical protein
MSYILIYEGTDFPDVFGGVVALPLMNLRVRVGSKFLKSPLYSDFICRKYTKALTLENGVCLCVFVCVCVSAATLETACFLSGMSAARYKRVIGGVEGGDGCVRGAAGGREGEIDKSLS